MMLKRAVLLAGLILGLSSMSLGGSCSVGTMASYIGTSCTIGNLTFSGFTYSDAGFGGATPIPASGVTVTPITTGGELGFQFEAPWIVSGAQGLDSTVQYTVTATTGTITDLLLSMAGFSQTKGGDVQVDETAVTPPLSLMVFDNSTGFVASDMVTGLSLTSLSVVKDIAVTGNNGTAGVSIVDNQYSTSPVPEPASMVLLGSGLLALAGFARCRRQHRS